MSQHADLSDLDAESLYLDLKRGVAELCASTTQLVGIATGGAWIAERLQRDLQRSGPAGVISSSMHRDDYAQRGLNARAQTQLPFDAHGADILLLDDVLYTGRTIRAVLNELFDYGRPAFVRLAVLVDRGGRELPFQADYASARVSLPASQLLHLRQDERGLFRLVLQDLALSDAART